MGTTRENSSKLRVLEDGSIEIDKLKLLKKKYD